MGETGVQTGHLRDISPWGLGLNQVCGPPLDVGGRVQVAFGYDRWAISRAAEVRRQHQENVGLALAAPLPEGLWARLLDLASPRLAPAPAGRKDLGPLDGAQVLQRNWMSVDDEWVGRITVGRWWRSTWLAHQLTICADHPEADICCRDLCRFAATAPRYSDGPSGRLAMLYDPNDPNHLGFTARSARWLDNPALAVDLHLDRFGPEPPPSAASIRVERVPIPAYAAVSDAFATAFPALACAALGWTEAALTERAYQFGSLFVIHSPAASGLALVDGPLHDRSPGTNALTWLLCQSGSDVNALVAGARIAAARCGHQRAVIFCPRRRGGPTAAGLMVWSGEALKQFDADLNPQLGGATSPVWRLTDRM